MKIKIIFMHVLLSLYISLDRVCDTLNISSFSLPTDDQNPTDQATVPVIINNGGSIMVACQVNPLKK